MVTERLEERRKKKEEEIRTTIINYIVETDLK